MTPGARAAFLTAAIARSLHGRRHVAVGANLPIPAAAALLARELSGGALRVDILGSRRFESFPGLGGLYDFACQGRYDGFFLSPGQIDGAGNINLVGVGEHPRFTVRWPGSHGAPLLYMMIPGIILFRETHLPRGLVAKVDFISAPGTSPPGVHRPGGPAELITDLGRFSFDRTRARFRLESVHPGHTVDEIEAKTGFAFERAATLAATPWPAPGMAEAIESCVLPQIAQVYPQFAQALAASSLALRAALAEPQLP